MPRPISRRLALGWSAAALAAIALPSCASAGGRPAPAPPGRPSVLAAESFLADIAQNVAGDRLTVGALIPLGVDPHGFEPTPADAARVSACDLMIVNGAGFEAFLEKLLASTGSGRTVVEASEGLPARKRKPTEGEDDEHGERDPHFWLDPILVIRYAENIAAGLTRVDPGGGDSFATGSAAYATRLRELDAWAQEQMKPVPPERRLLVTNHESFGYFADRYGFSVVGTIIPTAGTGAMPSARDMAHLTQRIRQTGARAIFLETGSSPQLAQAIGRESGVKVVTSLHTHSLTEASGSAPTYIEMMRHNVREIVGALS